MSPVSSAMGETEVVRAGSGIGILHRYIAQRYPELVAILPMHQLTRSYWIVFHEDLRSNRRIGVVTNFLAEVTARDRQIFV